MERLRFGRYETLRLIASGGMAKVYVGRASGPAGFERLVAIKVMHEHIASDPDLGHMFLDEARLAAGIRHPNVVPTLDVAEDGRFLVMELVDGASLRDILRGRTEPLQLALSTRIVLDMLEGLHAAHEHKDRDGRSLNIVHRDVSPHNILVGADGVSRITDFGIAYAEARLTTTRAGQLKGKMPYMAPEQLRGVEVDRRVDVYAAGCVLWELLAGERLFTADNEAALACLVLEGPKRPPSALNSAIPSAIDDACMQALLPPAERFQNARAFADALEHAIDDAGILVARPRTVALLTEGLRPILAEETAPITPAPITPGEGATTHTATVDVAEADLPQAVRPITVTGAPAAPREAPALENDGTSASLVAPVRRSSSTSGRVAIVFAGAALAIGTAWLALRDDSTTDTVRSDASSDRATVTASATAGPPPTRKAAASSTPAPSPSPPPRAAPADRAAAGPLPTVPSAAPSAAPKTPPPVSSVLHPDRL